MASCINIHIQDDVTAIDFRRCPKISWTTKKKEFLCLLKKCFRSEWSKFSQIYNAIFASDLRKEGFVDGAPSDRLKGQWADLKKKRNYIYQHVEHSLDLNTEIAREIDTTCRALNIELTFRDGMASLFNMALKNSATGMSRDDISAFKRQKTTRESFVSRISFSTTHPEKSLARCQPSILREPVLTSTSTHTTTVVPDPPIELSSPALSKKDKNIPRLLFRAWSSESSGANSKTRFVAGLWQDNPDLITNPNSVGSQIFILLARVHLSRIEMKSCFISLTQNPLDAIRRAMNHQPSYISVFDTSKLSLVYSAQAILKDDPIIYGAARNREYIGKNEWLVWGDISTEAIIATVKIDPMCNLPKRYRELFQFDTLRKYHAYGRTLHSRLVGENRKVSQKDGVLFGYLFQEIDLSFAFAEELAMVLAKAWHMKSKNGDFTGFLQGVRLSYGQFQSETDTGQDGWTDVAGDCEWEDISSENVSAKDSRKDIAIPKHSVRSEQPTVHGVNDGIIDLTDEAMTDSNPVDNFASERARVDDVLRRNGL